MRLGAIVRFELAYQLRRAWPWGIFATLLVLSFLIARDTSFAEAQFETFFLNSPFAIAKNTVIGGLFWLLMGAVIAGEAGARDVATRMYPLAYTTSVTEAEYLGGRFLAALALNAALLLAVPLGMLVAFHASGVDARFVGPVRPAAYLTAYLYIALPNALAATAVQFALAVRSGRAMAAYLGSVLFVFLGFFLGGAILYKRTIGTLVDPVGIRFVVEDMANGWTSFEKQHRLVSLDGALLSNRLLWIGVALGVLALTHARFRLAHRAEGGGRRRRAVPSAPQDLPAGTVAIPDVAREHHGFAIHARRTLAIARASFRTMALSLPGLGLLLAIPAMTVLIVADQMSALGTPLVPSTARVLRELTGGLTAELAAEPSRWIIVPLVIVFLAGELVWREREAGIDEIVDAMPGSDWAPFLGRLLGLAMVLATFLCMLMGAGVVAQAILGHRDFDVLLYLQVLLGLQLGEYLLFAVLALVIHVVVNQKYVGHLVALLAYAWIAALAGLLGVEHNLLLYLRGPSWAYTEMRGYGGTLGPWMWFKAYWAAWAVLLAVAARLLWPRGRERALRMRLREARDRLTRPTLVTAGVAGALVVALGGFLFWNTNVRNAYVSSSEAEERRAEYERRYRRYEEAPQPRLAATRLRVELFPERRALRLQGTHRLVHEEGASLDSVHVTLPTGVDTRAITFDRPARLAHDDPAHGFRTYVLARPLAAGDTLGLAFEVRIEPRGFGNRGAPRALVANGSALDAGQLVPLVGYQRGRELLTAGARTQHGLPPRPILGALYDVEGREPAARGGGVAFDAVVGTSEDQVAVAPGALRRTWTEGGRRWFHYATSAPIGVEWAIFSARYAVREARWRDVTIRIVHDPRHGAHVPRTVRAVRASMDYYAAQYGPYPYTHLTIVERPGAPGNGMHADASMVTHGESFAAWTPREGRLDMPSWVVAHEMGHQWGLPYALVEGLPFMAEGLATYQAMQVVRASRGDAQLRKLMTFLRRPFPYPPMRRGQPLLRALDPHLARRKGPFAMWLLSEYMGADRVNGAIRRLTERSDRPGAPGLTTMDLYRELQASAPDSLRPLLHDLFEVNAGWQFATERVRADSLGDGTWRVTLDVRARKTVYDSTGVERELPMREWVPVGVFAQGDPGDELGKPLYLRLHPIRSGRQSITVTVKGTPVLAGLDPHHLLDWEEKEDDDDVETVETAARPASSGRQASRDN